MPADSGKDRAAGTRPGLRAFFAKGPVPLCIYIARESTFAVLGGCLIALVIVCAAVVVLRAYLPDLMSGPLPALFAACAVCLIALVLSAHQIMRRSRRIAQPGETLQVEAARVAHGDFGARVDESYRDLGIIEVDGLIDSFNKMAEALGSIDYMRRDFTSSVSHEFKTPIAAITGMCELVQDPKLPESERAEYLGLIHEQALRLSDLCDSVLSISRLDAQEIVEKSERTDVDEQIRRDAIMLSERWGDRDITLDLDLDSLPIETDPNLTHQIWINLIDNAYKYTPDGGSVRVASCTLPDGVEVTVTDTGKGMSPGELAHAFERFYQADRSHSSGGSGLGLPIVKRICDLLGGSVGCESEPGVGTTMTVILPRKLV